LEIPEEESRIVRGCDNCSADVFLLVTYGEQPQEPLYQNPMWLFNAYVVEGKTMSQIALEFGVSSMTISYWADKHQIPTRPPGRRSD
jgi:hypothetical protein